MNKQLQSGTSEGLNYFLAEKSGVLIVSLIGKLQRENAFVLEKCLKEVEQSSAKWIIFNFRDIAPEMDKNIVPIFARIQKKVREKPATLRLSSLHPELSTFLDAQGLIRPEELVKNLTEALKALPVIQSISAA